MKLIIDTTEIRTAKVTLDGITKVSQSILPLIDELLKEKKSAVKDITEIEVATGPGSFTGLRVGTAVANVFGFLLGIPVNGKKALVSPVY